MCQNPGFGASNGRFPLDRLAWQGYPKKRQTPVQRLGFLWWGPFDYYNPKIGNLKQSTDPKHLAR